MKNCFDVRAYTSMIEDRIQVGWSPSLLSFMFMPLRGSERAVQEQQRRIVERVYARFVTRLVRHPRALSEVGNLPIWICTPDFPVAKHAKRSLSEIAINDGQHVHGLCLIPPARRITDMTEHVSKHQALYTNVTGLMRLDAQAITHDVEYVVGYATKMIIRGRVDPDALLILPRAHSEVTTGRGQIGRNASIFASAQA